MAESDAYDMLLAGGHVIDPANQINDTRDVAIKGDRIVQVAADRPRQNAGSVVDVTGKYVVPGLVDIHVHYYDGVGQLGIYPDYNAFSAGVTTAVDAGTAGWRNFPDFRQRILDDPRIKCRVLAMLNIVSTGMATAEDQQNPEEMQPRATADAVREHADVVVGIKTAHYQRPDWEAVDRAIEAAELTGLFAMYDFAPKPARSYQELLLHKARPGDFHTHMYARHIPSIDDRSRLYSYIGDARRRGVLFDLGHGAGSFWYRMAVPCLEQGHVPDTISTDQHQRSVQGPVFTMLHTMSKILCLGMPLREVIERSTSRPARLIGRPELGTLSVGAEADIAVLDLQRGRFGYWDCGRGRAIGNQRLECALTLRAGQVVFDREGVTMADWQALGPQY